MEQETVEANMKLHWSTTSVAQGFCEAGDAGLSVAKATPDTTYRSTDHFARHEPPYPGKYSFLSTRRLASGYVFFFLFFLSFSNGPRVNVYPRCSGNN